MTSPDVSDKPDVKPPLEAAVHREHSEHQPVVEREDHASVEAIQAFESGQTIPKTRGNGDRVLPSADELLDQLAGVESAKPASVSKIKRENGDTVTVGRDASGAVIQIGESDGTGWHRSKDGKSFVMDGSTEKVPVKDVKIGEDGSYTLVMPNGDQIRRNADRSVSSLDAQGHERSRQNNDGSKINFDANHRVVSTSDANGVQRGYGYDRDGKLAAMIEPDGSVWRSTDGKNWQQTGTNQQRSGEITIGEDGSQTVKNGRGETTTFKIDGSTVSRDQQGRVVAVTDAKGTERHFAYDAQGKLAGVKDSDGTAWSSKDGGKTWQQSGAREPLKAEFSVDAAGNLHQKLESGSEVVKRTDGWTETRDGKSPDKTRVERTNQDGSSVVKNSLDQVIETKDATGKTRQFEYNEQGKIAKISDASGTRTSSDGINWTGADGKPAFKGRVDVSQDGLYREVKDDGTKSVYKPDGSIISVDAQNRISRVDQPGGAWRAFEYNNANQIAKVSDNRGNSYSTTDGSNWTKEGSTETLKMNAGVRLDGTYEEKRANGERFISTTDGRSLTFDKQQKLQTAEAADGAQMRYIYDAKGKVTSFELSNKDGSKVNFDAEGHVTRSEDKDHQVREYKYANGKLAEIKDVDGKTWTSTDSENWTSNTGEKSKGARWVSKDGQYNYATDDTVVSKQLDGNTMYRERSGATRLENKAGEVTETVDAKGVKRTYERNGQGDITRFTEGNDTWVKTDQNNWRNTRDGATWQGNLSVDQSGTYYQEDKDGNKQWRKPDGSRQNVIYKSMEVAADAIEYAMNGGLTGWGCDKTTINSTLENKTEAERQQIKAIWEQKYGTKYGQTLEAAFKGEMSGSDLDKSMALLKRPDGADNAGTIRVALTEGGEWMGRSKGELEKVVRNTLETMSAADIAKTDQEYRRRYGTSLSDAIQNDPNLSADTKAAAAVYMKGSDNRTPQETLDLAKKAATAGNVDMFQEAMRRAPKEVRDYFGSPEGRKLMSDNFEGHWYNALTLGWSGNVSDTDYRHVQDYAEFGKLSVSTQTTDNTSWLGDNEKAIEHSLSTMTDAERKSYMLGRQIANNESIDPSVTAEQRQRAQEYYTRTSTALKAAAGQWYSGDSQVNELAKWEDMIAQRNGGLVSRLADHRGTIYDSSMQDVISTVENMSKDDWEKLHSDPKQRERIETVLKTYLSDDELKRTMSIVDAKMNAASFDASQQNRRPVLDAIDDNRRWYNDDEAKIYESITNMTESERALYRKGSEPGNTDAAARTFAQALDQKLRDTLSASELTVANGLLDKVKRGEKPEMSVIDKMNVQASYTFSDKAQIVRDIQQAFDKDPTLQARIAHPQTDADRAYAEQFKDAAMRAMGRSNYETYAKPLIETGRIPTELQLDLNRGIFNDDEQGAYKDIQRASADEKQRILTDKAFQDRVLGFLSADERQVALASMQQGEMRPEDKLRSYQLGLGTSEDEIKETLTELNDRSQLKREGKSEEEIDAIIQQRLQNVRDEYARKYGTDLSADLVSELGGKDQRDALHRINGRDARSEFIYTLNDASTTRSGWGSGFVDRAWDGTGYQLDNEINQLAATMVQDPAKMRDYVDNVYKMIEMHSSSKEALADAIVDTTVAAVAVGGSFVSGGLSLSLLAYTGAGAAIFKVGMKAGIMGGDYDAMSSQLAVDAGTGFADGFTAFLGAGIGKSAAEKVIAQAGRSVLIEGSETTLKEGAEALIKQGLKEGAKVSDEAILSLAKQVARDGDQQAVAALLKKSIGEAMEEQSRSVLKQLVMSTPQNALAGFLGAAGSGTIRAANEARDFNEFVRMTATSAAFGTLGGTIGPFVLAPGAMAAGKAWTGLRAAVSREATTVDTLAARAANAAERRVPADAPTHVTGETSGLPRTGNANEVHVASETGAAPETYVRTGNDQPVPKSEAAEPYKVMEYKPQPGKPDVVAKPEAIAQSNSYKDAGEVRGKLEDGFQIVGGETRIGADGNFHDPNRPAIVLDRSQDQVLRDTIAEAHARLDKYRNDPKRLAEELAAFSKEKMQPAGWTNKQVDDADAMFRSQNGNNQVLLGDYIQRAKIGEGAGACQPQAMLMKVLGDDFGLDISMSTGYLGKVPPGGIPPGYSPNHAFTELHLKDQSLVFDPRNNITGTPIDRLPHLTPAREFRPGETVTPDTFQVKPGDVVAHDSTQWKISEEAAANPGDLVLRRDGQVSLTAKELSASNPDRPVKIGAEMEITVNGQKDGGWVVQGTNSDGTVRLTKADAVKIEVSPSQLAAENAQIARALGRDNQVLSGTNDLKPVIAELTTIQQKLNRARMGIDEKREIFDAIKSHLQVADPAELKALARQLADADLSTRGPAIKDLLNLSAQNPDIDLKFALRSDINIRDLEAYTSLAKSYERLQDVPEAVRDRVETALRDRFEIYSRTSRASDVEALRRQADNIADAIDGFSRNKSINPKIAENVAELLEMGADYPMRIAFHPMMTPGADVGAVNMYTELTRQGLHIDSPASASGGHVQEFFAFSRIRDLAGEGKLGDNWVFVASANASAADTANIDGAFLNLKTKEWVPVDFALDRDTVKVKQGSLNGTWALALKDPITHRILTGDDLATAVRAFIAKPTVPHLSIEKLQPPFGTGKLAFPEFRRILTAAEGDANGRVPTTIRQIDAIRNNIAANRMTMGEPELSFYNHMDGQLYDSIIPRRLETELAADLMPNIGNAVDVRLHPTTTPLKPLHPQTGVDDYFDKRGVRYIEFPRTNSTSVKDVKAVRLYEDGNVVGVQNDGRYLKMSSLKNTMERGTLQAQQTDQANLRRLVKSTPAQFDFNGKTPNQILREYPSIQLLGDAVENPQALKAAASNNAALDRARKAVDADTKLTTLTDPERVDLARSVLEARNALNNQKLAPSEVLAISEVKKSLPETATWQDAVEARAVMDRLHMPVSDANKALTAARIQKLGEGKVSDAAVATIVDYLEAAESNVADKNLLEFLARRYSNVSKAADVENDIVDVLNFYDVSKQQPKTYSPETLNTRYARVVRMVKQGWELRLAMPEALK